MFFYNRIRGFFRSRNQMPVTAFAEAYGHRGSEPGLSNEVLAKLIYQHRGQIDRLFVRWEIANALSLYGIQPDPARIVRAHADGKYMDTVDSLNQMVEWLGNGKAKGEELWVFCHRTHKGYIWLLLRLRGIKADRWVTTGVYDKFSHQPWTRGPLRSFLMKIGRGVKYLFHGRFFSHS
jgi:hypothetical protein